MEDVKGAVTIGSSPQTPPTLLTEFVAAARAADSFDEALQSALSTLCERLGVESAVLLEKVDDAYRGRIAIGAFASGEWNRAGRGVSRRQARRLSDAAAVRAG